MSGDRALQVTPKYITNQTIGNEEAWWRRHGEECDRGTIRCGQGAKRAAGLPTLSCNLGAGLGAGYCAPFKDQGQASIALLEQMPEVSSLHSFRDLKEIIRLFSIYSKTSITHARNHLEKDNFISDLTKMLVAADLQVKRREIFSVAEKPAGFRLAGAKGRKEGMDAAAFAREAERERQELKINLEEEFEHKKEAYVGELRGLRNSRDQLAAELKIKNKLMFYQPVMYPGGRVSVLQRNI